MISGGWLLVSNLVIDGSSAAPLFSVETSYRGIGNLYNNKTFLSKSAMNELRTHLSFTQLRFHCSKQQGRTFHVTTAANSTGEAVVQYFRGQTDVQPDSCGSFLKMDNDDSGLAAVCHKWGTDNGGRHIIKIKTDWSITLFLYGVCIIGFCGKMAEDWNAMICMLECLPVISGKYLFVKKFLIPDQTEAQVNTSSRKLNLHADLRPK